MDAKYIKVSVAGGVDLLTNLVAYWDLNETSGTYYDSHGSYDGTPYVTSQSGTGILSYCCQFDGIDDYVTIADADAFTFSDGSGNDLPFSISGWINVDSDFSGRFPILSKYGNLVSRFEWNLTYDYNSQVFTVQLNSGNVISTWMKGDSDTVLRTALAGTGWHHIVATYDGSEALTGIKIYMDNVDISSGSGVVNNSYAGMTNTDGPTCIGCNFRSNATYWAFAKGYIDEVGLWGKELTSIEVSALYNSGNGLAYTSF